MTYFSNSTSVSVANEELAAAFIEHLGNIASILSDGLDHPEIWPILAHAGAAEDATDLIAILATLRPQQLNPFLVKVFDLVSGILTAGAGDQPKGMAMLKQMETLHSLCPQVAGACFFVSRLGDPGKSADLSTKFCESPFIKFETLIDGTVAPCCSIWTRKRLGNLEQQNFEEIWNSVDAMEMRESILDGSYRYCNKQRCTLIMDDSLPERDDIKKPDLRAIIDEGKTLLDSPPRWLFLAHDVTCNLACPSCRSNLIAADEAQEARFSKIEEQVFFPLLSEGKQLTISVSGQGDPWSSRHYRSILRYIADHDLDVQLDIYTNALLMNEKRWQDYLGLEKYHALVDVSIDACTPWVYEVVRRPGNWDRLEPNLRFIAEKRLAGIFREFHINATIQLDNFHEIPGLVDLAGSLGCDTARFYMMQNTGGHIAKDYSAKNVGDEAHPLHFAFLETLRDPKLSLPIVHLYDVGTWRKIAFDTHLPSDDLGPDYTYENLYASIEAAMASSEHGTVAALCAAGRIRFPNDLDILRTEALTLEVMGYTLQAEYRKKMAFALNSGNSKPE